MAQNSFEEKLGLTLGQDKKNRGGPEPHDYRNTGGVIVALFSH